MGLVARLSPGPRLCAGLPGHALCRLSAEGLTRSLGPLTGWLVVTAAQPARHGAGHLHDTESMWLREREERRGEPGPLV